MPAKYRVAVIGHTGQGNYGHGLDTVWTHMDECEIVGVSDPDKSGRAAAAKRLKAPTAVADYRELLDTTKPELVSICPRWLNQHREMVLAAAERGIHIYMEKPFCRTLAEADEMVAVCEKQNVKLAIAFQTRYSPKLPVIRDLIEAGRIGDILEVRGRGKEDQRGGGEDLWVLGSHVFNLMHHLFGEPESCFAIVKQNGKPVSKMDAKEGNEGIGLLTGDSISAVYEMDNDVTGYFATQRSKAGGRFGLQIYGSKGIIEVLTGYLPKAFLIEDPNWSPGRSGKQWQAISTQGVDQPEIMQGANSPEGNVAACRDLISAIEEDRQPEANIYEARTTVEMTAAVFESHLKKSQVRLPLENRNNPLAS